MVKALLTTDYIHANVRGILLYVGVLGVLFCLGIQKQVSRLQCGLHKRHTKIDLRNTV